jgi:O-acetyl-ADP-ribose deacetylase (regulator of RNase III)
VPIDFVSGDLFANAHGVEAFAHGCNCQGSMGAGIAKGTWASWQSRIAGQPETVRWQATPPALL